MKAFLKLIREIDFYGKAPVFYFKGKIKNIYYWKNFHFINYHIIYCFFCL